MRKRYFQVQKGNNAILRKDGLKLLTGELFTERELMLQHVPLYTVKPVMVEEADTFWFIGSRLTDGKVVRV